MSMKKKIFICFTSFQVGGVSVALLNLLRNISYNKYSIDLLCLSHEGPLKSKIPAEVNILKTNSILALLGDSQKLTYEKSFFLACLRFFFVGFSRIFGSTIIKKLIFNIYGRLKGYDISISFTHDLNHHIFCGGTNRFVAEYTDAPVKISFVHCDFENYGGNCFLERNYYSRFNLIACCSYGAKSVFDKICPSLNERTRVVYNCIDYNRIDNGILESEVTFAPNIINIVSVCRLSEEKGIDRALIAVKEIVIRYPSLDFHWHVVGDGPQANLYKTQCSSLGLDKIVTFYGEKTNPYPYIKQSTFFFLPSKHECAPIVFNESLYLGIPILATRTISVVEMIECVDVGYVCENSIAGIINGLEYVLINKDVITHYRSNISKLKLSNNVALSQFENILNES